MYCKDNRLKQLVYIGTSGWNYKHWRELIYPPKLATTKWLAYVAERFETVEVNTSFYRIPKRETVESWVQNTPPHFKFALKIWRGITHYRKLKNSAQFSSNFLDVAEALPPSHRAPLLLQLPPNQGKDVVKLRDYLQELHSLMKSRWQVAVEFRNAGWLHKEVYDLLNKEHAALCIHDMPGKADSNTPNDASFIYMRRHGTSSGSYSGSYSPEQVAADAKRIRAWARDGRSVYVYYNNDIGGHAFRNAEDLKRTIS